MDRVEPGAHMLRDALGAVASAGGRQLELAGRPSEWLGAPTATKGRRRVEAPGVRDWPALEAAKAAGWTFTYYDLASGERVSGIGAWTDARHSELTGDRWLTLHIPEIEPTVRAMLDLDAGELLDAMQSASRALGRRVQEWEGRGFKELVGKLRPDADAVLTATELPPASEQETDPEWSREVADDEWDGARLWVFDRSASYLRGMDSVVGCGELERLDAAGAALAAREKKLRPGSWLVRLTGPDPLAARDLPPVLDVTDRATWIPASTLALLRDLGGAYEVLGAALRTEVQTAFWDPVAKRMTEARDALLARGDDPAARVALEIVKRTYTAGLQQLDRTAGEVGQPWMRPDVHAGIVQHARALAVRAAASAKVRPVAYVAKDSMAWLLPASIDSPAAAAAAIGLRYGRRPGLWHESLTLPGEEVRAMLMAREPAGDLGGLRERARVARAARAGQSVSAGVPRTLARVVYGLVMGAKRNA